MWRLFSVCNPRMWTRSLDRRDHLCSCFSYLIKAAEQLRRVINVLLSRSCAACAEGGRDDLFRQKETPYTLLCWKISSLFAICHFGKVMERVVASHCLLEETEFLDPFQPVSRPRFETEASLVTLMTSIKKWRGGTWPF